VLERASVVNRAVLPKTRASVVNGAVLPKTGIWAVSPDSLESEQNRMSRPGKLVPHPADVMPLPRPPCPDRPRLGAVVWALCCGPGAVLQMCDVQTGDARSCDWPADG
jgi:hypothetical protein